MNNGIIIFSGYNIRAVIAFCRFAKRNGLAFHLLAKDKNDPIFLTEYSRNVFSTRKDKQINVETFLGVIQEIKTYYGYKKVLIVPSTESLNRFLLEHRENLEKAGIIIPLVNKELYEAISDKHSFGSICQGQGLCVPKEIINISNKFPFVAKPRNYLSSKNRQLKPYLIFDSTDLTTFQAHEFIEDYYFQEYVSGKSFYLLFCISKHGQHVVYSQENLIQQAQGGSIICAKSSTIHHEPIAKEYLNLLETLGFTGVIMIEIKQRDAKHYMIEANPRLWGPLQLVVDANIPIIKCFLQENGIPVHDVSKETQCMDQPSLYFWSGGIVDDQAQSKSIVFHRYTAETLVGDYSKLMKKDVFLRADTLNLYYKEIHAP